MTHVGQRRLARAVRAHDGVDLAAAHRQVDAPAGSPCRRRRPAGPRSPARLITAAPRRTGRRRRRRIVVDRHRPGGGQRVGLAGLERERAAVLPALDLAVVGVDLALGQRDVWWRAACRRWRRSRRRCARPRCGGRRRRTGGPRRPAMSSTRAERARRVTVIAQPRGRSSLAAIAARTRSRSAAHRAAAPSTSSKKPATTSRSADARRARPGSRGRSAAPRRSGRRPRRGCSARRCSRSRGWAPTRPRRRSDSLRLRLVWKALVPRASLPHPDEARVDGAGVAADRALEEQVAGGVRGAGGPGRCGSRASGRPRRSRRRAGRRWRPGPSRRQSVRRRA